MRDLYKNLEEEKARAQGRMIGTVIAGVIVGIIKILFYLTIWAAAIKYLWG